MRPFYAADRDTNEIITVLESANDGYALCTDESCEFIILSWQTLRSKYSFISLVGETSNSIDELNEEVNRAPLQSLEA